MQGPNVKKLIIHKMTMNAIPAGGGFMDGIKFLSDKDALIAGTKAATDWVALAIRAVREAAEPNQWKNATDEEIAAEILRGIEARKRKAGPS